MSQSINAISKLFRKAVHAAIQLLIYSMYTFSNGGIAFFLTILFRKPRDFSSARNVLIFRNGNIGDIICAIPAITAIRSNFPNARITLLSSPGSRDKVGARELLSGSSVINNLKVYYEEDVQGMHSLSNLVKTLREEGYDLFIELPSNLTKLRTEIRNIFFAKSIGCTYAFGFRVSTIRIFSKFQSRYRKFYNEVERLCNILRMHHLNTSGRSFTFPISTRDREAVSSLLRQFPKNPLVALGVGAKRETNLWPIERYAELSRRLIRDNSASILILGSDHDAARSRYLTDTIQQGIIDLSGRLSLLQTLELLKHCHLLISNDTGTIHMGSAVDLPVIGIYSSWQFRGKWYPYGDRNVIFRKEPHCHSCFRDKCDKLECLKQITVDEVFNSAKLILQDMFSPSCDQSEYNDKRKIV